MKYFLDTEFYEDGRTIDLISIGIVAEDGREFYAVSQEARLDLVSPWVRANVLPQLPKYGDWAWKTRGQIRDGLLLFTGRSPDPCFTFRDMYPSAGQPSWIPSEYDAKPEFWAYYADYDWVVFCQLFGTMMDLPKGFPMFCRDLKQLSVDVGSPEHPKQIEGEHDALTDARWNRDLYRFLMDQKRGV